MAVLKANTDIFKRCGGIKIWMWLCVERQSYLGFGNRVRMSKIGRNIVRLKDAYRVVYMAVDQEAWEPVENVNSCCDGRELLTIAKNRVGEKKNVVGVSCLKDESETVKVSVDDRKKIWKEHMEKLINVER